MIVNGVGQGIDVSFDACKHGIPKDSIWGCQECYREIFPAAAEWRKLAEVKAEEMRHLLIELDFRIQDAEASSCRETICRIEYKTQEIRNILAGE